MKLTWRIEALQLLPIAAMLVAAAACWSSVPERIPIHWNLHGEPDGFGDKWIGLLLFPAVAFAVYLLTVLLPLVDPRRANYASFATAYNTIRLTITLFLTAFFVCALLVALGYQIDMNRAIGLALGAMFIVFGCVMPGIRPNWFVGVRTPWTIVSTLSWTKTHQLAGWLFVGMGLLAVIWALVPTTWMFVLMMTVDAICIIAVIVYSYFVYRADPAIVESARGGERKD
jgi:uncharacterized membrane protein